MKEPVDADYHQHHDNIPAYLRSYSRLEKCAYAIGIFSQPKVVYEIAKFFISGQWKGGQGISEEELREYGEQKNKPKQI